MAYFSAAITSLDAKLIDVDNIEDFKHQTEVHDAREVLENYIESLTEDTNDG